MTRRLFHQLIRMMGATIITLTATVRVGRQNHSDWTHAHAEGRAAAASMSMLSPCSRAFVFRSPTKRHFLMTQPACLIIALVLRCKSEQFNCCWSRRRRDMIEIWNWSPLTDKANVVRTLNRSQARRCVCDVDIIGSINRSNFSLSVWAKINKAPHY